MDQRGGSPTTMLHSLPHDKQSGSQSGGCLHMLEFVPYHDSTRRNWFARARTAFVAFRPLCIRGVRGCDDSLAAALSQPRRAGSPLLRRYSAGRAHPRRALCPAFRDQVICDSLCGSVLFSAGAGDSFAALDQRTVAGLRLRVDVHPGLPVFGGSADRSPRSMAPGGRRVQPELLPVHGLLQFFAWDRSLAASLRLLDALGETVDSTPDRGPDFRVCLTPAFASGAGVDFPG